jgi:TonB-dependent receptor-like protein
VEAGFEVHRLDTGWSMHGLGELPAWWTFRGPALAPNVWGSRGDTLDMVNLEGSRDSSRWGAWLQADLGLPGRVSLQPGLRLERNSINQDLRLLPRLAAVWRAGPSTRVTAGLGWYAQSPGFEKVILSDTFLDFGGTAPLPLRSESARLLTLGVEHDLAPGWRVRADVYHKRFDDLIVGRLETDEELEERLASYLIPHDFPGGPPLERLITASPVNDGHGSARGFELSLVRRPASASAKLGGTLSYSYGVANRHSYGLSYPFDYDRRHALTLALDLQLTRSLGFSASWRGATGLPYTPQRPVVSFGLEQLPGQPPRRTPSRQYVVGDPTAEGPLTYAVGPGPLSDMNSARHPFYSRLDLRARFQPGGPSGRWELYLDVYNALNSDVMTRHNGPAFRPSLTWDEATRRWQIVNSTMPLAVLPSFGLRFRF